jgi:hypothetical protein
MVLAGAFVLAVAAVIGVVSRCSPFGAVLLGTLFVTKESTHR